MKTFEIPYEGSNDLIKSIEKKQIKKYKKYPTLNELKEFNLTPEILEKLKNTPVDINPDNWEKDGKPFYRKEYKKLFQDLSKCEKSPEPLVDVSKYGILGENYYYERAVQTEKDVLKKVFSGSNFNIDSISIKSDLGEKELTELIEKLSSLKDFSPENILKITNGLIQIDSTEITEEVMKRLIISLKIIRSNLKFKKLKEEGYLENKCYIREGVAKRLQILNKKLKELGLQVKIISAYRRKLVQKRAREGFSQVNKGFNFVASESPHSTGGAMDIELITYPDGKPLKMKFENFLKRRQTSSPLYSEKLFKEGNYTQEQLQIIQNRRLLYNLMKSFGFVGHYKEYWHFGLGDPLSEFIRWERNGKKGDLYYKYYKINKK